MGNLKPSSLLIPSLFLWSSWTSGHLSWSPTYHYVSLCGILSSINIAIITSLCSTTFKYPQFHLGTGLLIPNISNFCKQWAGILQMCLELRLLSFTAALLDQQLISYRYLILILLLLLLLLLFFCFFLFFLLGTTSSKKA